MAISNTALTTLFLQASVDDSYSDYKRSLTNPAFPHWDAVIITASNELQAEGYRRQIEYRRSLGRLPLCTEFYIVPDKDNKRVGSAGSTLSVIRMLKEKYGDLSEKRFLTIHAGGNSSRCPQYSALGKLFSPVPAAVEEKPAALFDLFMISMASVPGRLKDGMLLLSGDVVLLFNPLMCDFGSAHAAVISFKEDVETCKNHGVYIRSESGNVKKFLHKQSVERLKAEGAVDERNMCSIDTGAIWLCPEILESLYALVDTDVKYDELVNEKVRLSLYSDIAYSLAEDSTLEDFYNETPEGEFCDELTAAREKLWNAIGRFSMKLMNIAPAKFVHWGSIPEILHLMCAGVAEYEPLGWKKQINCSMPENVVGYNSVLRSGAAVGKDCYLEVSYVHGSAKIGSGSYISYVDIHDETVPDNVLIHGLKQTNGMFVVRIMGTHDNPKQEKLFGRNIAAALAELGVPENEIWNEGDAHTLWLAKLYPECANIKDAVQSALLLYDIFTGKEKDVTKWLSCVRKSLNSGFNEADPQAIIDWNTRMEDLIQMDRLSEMIKEGRPAMEAAAIFGGRALTAIQYQWLEKELKKLDTSSLKDFSYAMRLYFYLGIALRDENYTEKCFKLITDTVLDSAMRNLKYVSSAHIVSDEISVKLPLRVNWGGGWTDTCPYCQENGGVVINTAISLNGELPVEVRFVRTDEKKIVFESRDMDVHGEFTDIRQLQKTGDPFDPFALQKACLIACGIIPVSGGSLDKLLTRLGGGFKMYSEVTNVPKGSGLGTSSILSAAAVKATFEFMGIPYDDDLLYSTVLAMEQIMSTGGGWQDQVGGVTPGIKLISSNAGIDQKINVEKVHISDETKRELSRRFCIIYTGQRRLARNLLREVVGRYVGNVPESLYAHRKIERSAVLMKFALERGDVDDFARLLDEHWELSKMIDDGSTNTLIDQIFLTIEDLIDAKMICGAGGGGFLQVILKKGVTKEAVHDRLKAVFQDFAVDVWPSEIVY